VKKRMLGVNMGVGVVVATLGVLGGFAHIETSSWQAPSNEFSKGLTYCWDMEALNLEEVGVDIEFLAPRVIAAVEAILNEKGYRKAEGAASLLLKPSVQLREKSVQVVSQENEMASTSGMLQRKGTLEWEWTIIPEQVNVEVYEEGTLLLSVSDAASGKTVWQGSASLRVDRSRSPKQKERLLKKVVRLLMESFPDNG
jgi:hypothetical protein